MKEPLLDVYTSEWLDNKVVLQQMVPKKVMISVVVSVYNEEDNVGKLIAELNRSLEGFDYELIIVNDGSFDNTEASVRKAANGRVKLISFVRNFGQTATLAAGFRYATGDYCVTLDGDLQNNPRDILRMLQHLIDNQLDIVVGWRQERQDKALVRKLPSAIANYTIRRLTGLRVHDLGCALKVMKTPLAKSLPMYGEMHRYISLLAQWQGARMGELPVSHRARVSGRSKYGLKRTFNVISDMMFLLFFENYRSKPIHFFGKIGTLSILLSAGLGIYLLAEKIRGNDIGTRPLLELFVISVFSGFVFLL